MWLERQDNGLVNLTTAFTIDIETDYNGKPYVVASSAGSHGEGEQFIMERTLYSGDMEGCEAYMAWLKKELQVPRGIIPHTFEPPVESPADPTPAQTDYSVDAESGWKPAEDNLPRIGSTVWWKSSEDAKILNGKLLDIENEGTEHERAVIEYKHPDWTFSRKLRLSTRTLLIPDDSTERDGEEPPEPIDMNNEQFS